MLSNYCKKFAEIKVGDVKKLVPNLRMKKYIDLNTEKRKNTANDFEKDFF